MGLFGGGGVSHRRVTLGQDETDALQPGLFDAWNALRGLGGIPGGGDLQSQINDAYSRAAQEAGALAPGGAGFSIGSDVARRGGIGNALLQGNIGLQGQRNLQNITGQQAGYLGALTAGRPQFAATSEPDALSRAGSLLSFGGRALLGVGRAMPDTTQQVDPFGLMGPGAGRGDPFAGARTF
jgi:hypothetical protein